MRPLIGISTRGVPGDQWVGMPENLQGLHLEGVFSDYPESVSLAGGVPVLLPRSAPVEDLVGLLDGLIISGGEDVEPDRYGGTPSERDTRHDPDRDRFELALVSAAIDAGVPILAICRGCQLLNVALGGTLIAHLDDADFNHAMGPQTPEVRRHTVTLSPDSALGMALRPYLDDSGALPVNSFHHQAVDRPGSGLRVVARAHDGTIEAIEVPGRPVFGVQWHPEMHEGVDPIFPWFIGVVEEARQHSRRRVESA